MVVTCDEMETGQEVKKYCEGHNKEESVVMEGLMVHSKNIEKEDGLDIPIIIRDVSLISPCLFLY